MKQRRPDTPYSQTKTTRRVRDRSLAQTIKQVLQLDDKEYTNFYAFVATIFKTSRLAGTNFSTIERKNYIRVEVFSSVLERCNHQGRFGDTARIMQTDAGREAFQKLVYRINANMKRRNDREHKGMQDDANGDILCRAADTPSTGGSDEHERDGAAYEPRLFDKGTQYRIEVDDAIWVTLKTGVYKAVCLASDIAKESLGIPVAFYSPGDLLLSGLEDLLTLQYGFDRKFEHLELDQEQEKPAMIEGQGDWERLLMIRCRQGKSLKFLVVRLLCE